MMGVRGRSERQSSSETPQGEGEGRVGYTGRAGERVSWSQYALSRPLSHLVAQCVLYTFSKIFFSCVFFSYFPCSPRHTYGTCTCACALHFITLHMYKSNHNHSSALMTSARKGNTWVPLIDVPLSANLRRRFRSITQSDSANNNRRARSFLPRPNVIFPHFHNHSLRFAFSSPCSLS